MGKFSRLTIFIYLILITWLLYISRVKLVIILVLVFSKNGLLNIYALPYFYVLDYVQQQKDPKSGELEGLSYEFDLCEAVATWEQVGVAVLKIWVIFQFIEFVVVFTVMG